MKKIFILAVILLFSVSCVSRVENKSATENALQIVINNDSKNSVAGGFLTLQNTWARYQTEVFAETSEQGLNFEFYCYGNVEEMVFSAKKADDDMTLFGSDHIELQLAPDWKNSKKYYHFAVNPAGSVYHAEGHDTSWTPKDFTYSIEKLKDCYKIAVGVTWETLGVQGKPADGTVWKGNFCRASKFIKSPVEFSSWTGAQSFHEINQMGNIVFGNGRNPVLRVLKCNIAKDNIETSAALNGSDGYIFQMFCNDELQVEKKLHNKSVINNKVSLKNKYIPLKSKDKITFKLSENGSVVWEKTGFIINGTKEFISLDKFEYLKNSAMKINVASLPGDLIIKNDSKVFLQQKVSASPAVIELKDLPDGRYIVEYTSNNCRSSRVFFVINEAPFKAAPLPKNGKMTVNGRELLFDNKPFYLLGISGGSKTHFPYDPGFHLLYGKGARANAPAFQHFPGKSLIRKPVTSLAFNHNWQQQISQFLNRQSKYSGNYWRSICYEANIKVSFKEKDGSVKFPEDGYKVFGEIYAMAKKAMPNALFSIHVDNIAVSADYVDFCDVLEFASWRSSYHASDMLLNQGEDLDFVSRTAINKPFVMWLGGSIPNAYCRTAEEMRAGVYHTIIKGGVGNIIHMGHGGIPASRSRFWSMLSMLQREINDFYADFKNGTPYEFEFPYGFVGKAVVTTSGDLLLIILNKSAVEQSFEFDISGYGAGKITFTPFEPRVIKLSCVQKED